MSMSLLTTAKLDSSSADATYSVAEPGTMIAIANLHVSDSAFLSIAGGSTSSAFPILAGSTFTLNGLAKDEVVRFLSGGSDDIRIAVYQPREDADDA